MIFLAATLLYWKFRALPINWHGNIPEDLDFDQKCLENGIIPENLAWAVPLDYVERVGWSVTSRIDRTFVTETRTPKWNLEITMSNPQETSIVNVTYNLDGSLFEY